MVSTSRWHSSAGDPARHGITWQHHIWRHPFYFGQSIHPAEIVCILAGRVGWYVNNRHQAVKGKPKLQFVCCRFERQEITGSAARKIKSLRGQGCSPVIGFKCYKLYTYTKIDFTLSSVERFSIYLFTLGINISTGNLIGSGTFFTVPEHLVARFQKAAGDREINIPKQSQRAVATSSGSW